MRTDERGKRLEVLILFAAFIGAHCFMERFKFRMIIDSDSKLKPQSL